MVNKVVMSVYGFKYELSLLLAQLIVGTLAMKLFSSMGFLSLPSLSVSPSPFPPSLPALPLFHPLLPPGPFTFA